MSRKGLGMTCVANERGELLGIITDGDLRRLMERAGDTLTLTAADVMTRNPATVEPRMLAAQALNLLEQRRSRPWSSPRANRSGPSAWCTCTTCGERRWCEPHRRRD